MQPVYTPPSSGKTSFIYGLIFAIGLTVVSLILSLVVVFAFHGNTALALIFSGVNGLIGLVAYLLVGLFAAKRTGKVSTGTIAGLWTGVIYGVLYAIYSIIILVTITGPQASSLQTSNLPPGYSAEQFANLAIGAGVFGIILGMLCGIGIGAGVGALGGLWGRHLSNVPRPEYQQAPYPYPGQPYPGQPYQGQAQPGYPAQPYPGQPYPGQPYQGQSQPGYPSQPQSEPYSEQPYSERHYSDPQYYSQSSSQQPSAKPDEHPQQEQASQADQQSQPQ